VPGFRDISYQITAIRRQEKAYTEDAESTEFTEKREERPKTQAPAYGGPGATFELVEGEKKCKSVRV